MDLLSFLGVLGRHKLVTALMVLASAGVIVAYVRATPRLYEARATLVLLNPPSPPTRAEVKEFPSLAKIKAANPYARFNDLSIVADIVAKAVQSPSVKDLFVSEGYTGAYAVTSVDRTDTARGGPIVELSAQGTTKAHAIFFASRLANEFRAQLAGPQTKRRIDPNFQVKADTVVPPEQASPVLVSLLRAGVAILALCAFATLAMAFLADAVARARARRRTRREDARAISRAGSA